MVVVCRKTKKPNFFLKGMGGKMAASFTRGSDIGPWKNLVHTCFLKSKEPRLCKDDWIMYNNSIKLYAHIRFNYIRRVVEYIHSKQQHIDLHTYIQKVPAYLRTIYEPCRAKRRSSRRGSSFCMSAIASPHSHSPEVPIF